MYMEIRKDYLRSIHWSTLEAGRAVSEAMEFAGGKGMYVNFDKIIDQIRAEVGRSAARQLLDALTGDLENLPLLALTGDALVRKIATDRLESDYAPAVRGTSGTRCTVIHDEAKIIPSRRSALCAPRP